MSNHDGATRKAQTLNNHKEVNACPVMASWCRVRGEALIVATVLWRLVVPPGFRCFRVALLVRGQRLNGRRPVMHGPPIAS
ncbi:hypothetical protein [Pseudarthrobacter sp. PvP090]|uniref:hypothetical protein n=1 Tax=Pseudarthrobacter sp. PvP090 TaxID=3156393 RepID=UPI003392F53A